MTRFHAALLLISAVPVFAQPGNPVPGLEPAPKPGPAAAATPGRGGRGAATPATAVKTTPSAPGPRDLKYPPLHTVQMPKPVTATLANGMRIYLVEQREMPVLGGAVMVRTGSALDPPERIGLGAVAGILLRGGGTALKTGEQVENTLRSLGMNMESQITDSTALITFTALKENTAPSLNLVREVLTQAEFRQDRIEQAKAQLRNNIAHRNDEPAAIVRRELAGLIFGKDSPYGWHTEYSTLDRITRIDLKNFHKRYFFPANTMFGLWGDFDSTGMKTQLEHIFADWTVKQDPVPDFPKTKATPAPGLYLAEKKDVPQTYFAIGHVGGVANQKDAATLEVMGLIFNQLQARITRQTRSQLGTTNVALIGVAVGDVNSGWGAGFDRPGIFRVAASTRGASTVEALKAVKEDIDRMRSVEPTEEELRIAKEAAQANLAVSMDTHGKAFLRMMQQEYNHYPWEFAQQYQTAVAAVTRADVLRVAKQYLNPAELTTVVVGNPQVFSQPLEKLNPQVNRIDITIPEAKGQTTVTTDASIAEGKRLLGRAQTAAGGVEKLSAVKDYSITADYLIDPTVQNLGGSKVVQVDRWLAPGVFRQDLSLSTGRITAYTDGKAGWILTPQGSGALIGTQLKQVQGDLFRSYVRLLLSDRIEGRTVNQVDQDLIEVSDTTGQIVRLEFDAPTGLPKRATYDVPQAAGAPLFSEDVYGDYRDIDGVKVPFSVTITQGGRKFADVKVTDYKMNSGLKPVDLARRQ
jgi:zinc protease